MSDYNRKGASARALTSRRKRTSLQEVFDRIWLTARGFDDLLGETG